MAEISTKTAKPAANAPKVLITGGAGFIGSHLAEALLNKGSEVTVIDNLSTGRFENIAHLAEVPGFYYAIDTITNEVVMDRLVSECETIIHLAAAVGVELIVKDPIRVIETNILGTQAVLQVANRYRKKVLIASTSEIYGKNNNGPFQEDDDRLLGPTTKSRWSYSTSKAVDEFLGLAYHRQNGLPVVIFRLFNTVGPRQTGQYGMVVPRFIQQAIKGTPLTVYGDGQQTRCFCDISDVIQAIIGLAEYPKAVGHVFNVGSTEEITILGLAQQVLELMDAYKDHQGALGRKTTRTKLKGKNQQKDQIVFVPYKDAYEPGFEDMFRRVPNIRKIKATINWEPKVTLENTLRRVFEWHVQKSS